MSFRQHFFTEQYRQTQEIMGKKDNRKSIVADTDGSVSPDYDLRDAVRTRKHKMLKATMHSVSKLTAEDNDASIRVLKSELESK